MSGTANNGGKNSSRSIISGKSSFAHARTIVNNKSGYLVVTHVDLIISSFSESYVKCINIYVFCCLIDTSSGKRLIE